MTNNFGKLYLVPNLLGATKPEQVIPAGTLSIVKRLKYFVVENTRTSRRVLSRIGMDNAIDDIEFIELDKHNARNLDLMEHLGACLQGEDMGLMSEAGTPCVADPGALVVDLAHSAGIQVIPLVGPNAMILALMASGFNGQAFAFHGYLPIKSPERQNAIKDFPYSAKREQFALLVMKSKYELAERSVDAKRLDRYRDAEDECYGFINEYPDSNYKKLAERYIEHCKKYTKDIED